MAGCYKCGRELENYSEREIEIVDGEPMVIEDGAGTCPEHGIMYDSISAPARDRRTCKCGKDDCPVCSARSEEN